MPDPASRRVIAYEDGYNLYYGLRAKGWKRYYWLDVRALAINLLKPGQHLVAAKYFTALVDQNSAASARQSEYLEALQAHSGVSVYYGHYLSVSRTCRSCGHIEQIPSEKMTDVNIAVELLVGAFHNDYDVALLISADSDLIPPVRAIRSAFPDKRVVVAMPPGRFSVDLARSADGFFQVGRAKIAHSLLPPEVTKPNGYVLRCPPAWR